MYPDERELVDRYRGRRFAVLSVSADDKVETLRQSIKDGEITWRCWWDEGKNGPICRQWEVTRYPSIYVLDSKGVIRYRGVTGDELKRSVNLLMQELEN